MLRFSLLLVFLLPLMTFAQLSSKDNATLRTELAQRVNNLRESKGLKLLIFNDTLQEAAQFHSDYMAKAGVISHEQSKSKYRTPEKRVKSFKGKFELVGENIAEHFPPDFPLKKKDLSAVADALFESWENSAPHFANMTNPEYTFGDFGFQVSSKKKAIYVTQVFGKKVFEVDGQLSRNGFGISKAPEDCEEQYNEYSNLILNIGNDMRIEGNEVILYFHNIDLFKQMFPNSNDGIAVDLITKDQLACGKANQLDGSPVYDGIMLKPIYIRDILASNRAQSDYRLIAKVGEIPNELMGNEYSISTILIKSGKACQYMYPAFVPREDYELLPFDPIINDEPSIKLVEKGVIRSVSYEYNFENNSTNPIDLPEISKLNGKVHSIHINSFSSVGGDSIHNAGLHNSRANFIKNHLQSNLSFSPNSISISAKENWEQMNFQLQYFGRDDLAILSRDSIRALIALPDTTLAWDSFLFAQRRATAIINYIGVYDIVDARESLGEFNLRTAVANKNVILANKAMYEMANSYDYAPSILFEPQVIDFMKVNPKTLTNYCALLSFDFQLDPYAITDFIHHWLPRTNELTPEMRSNLLHLYTLVGRYLLDTWDVSAERLSNVIHPLKVDRIASVDEKSALMINKQLVYIHYFGQVNDSENINKAFDLIADYFLAKSVSKEDDLKLALFFNYWSMYHKAVPFLLEKMKTNELTEEGLFALAMTMNFTHFEEESGEYLEVHKKALKQNKPLWCEWITEDYQVKRNAQIKLLYCEECE